MAKHTSQSSLSSLTPTLTGGDERTSYGIPKILGPNGSDISLDLGNHGMSKFIQCVLEKMFIRLL